MTPGRQGTGYFKQKLLSWEPYFDLYLLKYPKGSYIPPHLDPVPGRKHYRCNLTLKHAAKGGKFWCRFPLAVATRSLIVFRPDESEHGVDEILEGTRYVLSLGITTEKDKYDPCP